MIRIDQLIIIFVILFTFINTEENKKSISYTYENKKKAK